MFIPPMLASPLPNTKKNPKAKPFVLTPGQWVAEEKYDGQRIGVEINDNAGLFTKKGVTAWTRYGNEEHIPPQIREELDKLPNCYIDGELMAPGLRSFGTMDHANRGILTYVVFDIVQYEDVDMTPLPYLERRNTLISIFAAYKIGGAVRLSFSERVETWDRVLELRDQIWAQDGEGLILKNIESTYAIGKRNKNWVKIKKLNSAVLTVTGFAPSRGQINNRGPFGMTLLVDEDGYTCSVKTKNDAQCRAFEAQAPIAGTLHPSIGRKLRIEFQERTPDGLYREPRWDRWEDE